MNSTTTARMKETKRRSARFNGVERVFFSSEPETKPCPDPSLTQTRRITHSFITLLHVTVRKIESENVCLEKEADIVLIEKKDYCKMDNLEKTDPYER